MKLAACAASDAPDLARLHAEGFARPWSAQEIAALLSLPGVGGLLAGVDGPEGMILWRAMGREAEILTVAVRAQARRRGLGRVLVEAAADLARQGGAEALFLEVAVDNDAALALYAAQGFVRVGRRSGYYDRGAEGRMDAFVLRRDLNTAGH